MRILMIILFLPMLSYCQTTQYYGAFVTDFSSCFMLQVRGNSIKENAIVYFETEILNKEVVLTHVIGEHKKEFYLVLRNAIDCMDLSKIKDGKYKCILHVDEQYSYHTKLTQREKERAEKIMNFKSRYALVADIEIIEVIYDKERQK